MLLHGFFLRYRADKFSSALYIFFLLPILSLLSRRQVHPRSPPDAPLSLQALPQKSALRRPRPMLVLSRPGPVRAADPPLAAPLPEAAHRTRLPDGDSQILRLYVFGPSGLKDLDCAPHPPPRRNPREGRDQILPSGNLTTAGDRGEDEECSAAAAAHAPSSLLEFGTALVYTCSASCWREGDGFKAERMLVQAEGGSVRL